MIDQSIDRYVCTIRVPSSRLLNEKENTCMKQGCNRYVGGGARTMPNYGGGTVMESTVG
jgi:hypothetical protein